MGCLKLTYDQTFPLLKVTHSDFSAKEKKMNRFFLSEEKSSAGKYRYGYQGSEKDNEVKGNGNSYTTHFRQLDPRLGRWLTIDPLASNLPWQSPYCSMDNNPIWFNDPMGDKVDGWIEQSNDKGKKTLTFDSKINTTKEAKAAGYENVTNVYKAATVSSSDKSYSYSLKEDGKVLNNSDNSIVNKTIITKNETIINIGKPEFAIIHFNESTVKEYAGNGPVPGGGPKLVKYFNKIYKISNVKKALEKVYEKLGGNSLPKGKPGKFGSPQRGTPKKGYRLDPGHPNRPLGHPENGPHINWWDFTKGKRGNGGGSGAIPIE